MKKRRPELIGGLLDAYLRQEGLETPLLQFRIVNSWADVMGQTVARYTGDIHIRGDELWVQIKSPALRQNLMHMRTDIARKMNEHVQAQVITKVSFY